MAAVRASNQRPVGVEPAVPPLRRGERKLRVLAAIVVPPHLTASGGASAGEALSAALARHCDMSLAGMMPPGGLQASSHGSVPEPARLPVATSLPFLLSWSRTPRSLRSLFYRSDIATHVEAGGYDLVHLHNPMPALETARIAAACRARGTPYVISTHGFNEVANGERIYGFGPARRLVWRRCVLAPIREVVGGAAAVFALSAADEPIVREMGFRGPVVEVPNGVAGAGAGEAARDAELCAGLGIAAERRPGEVTLMFLANHTPNKGLAVLARALERVRVPYLAVVAGERRPEIDYEALIRSAGPGQRIVVTGRLEDEAVPALFRRSDLFVFPTLADTFPLAVLEAMAHGLPVVASEVGGIPHQLDPQCGVLVPPGEPQRLAEAIEGLAAEPVRRHLMGLHARRRVERLFTWEAAARAACDGYAAALAWHSRRRASCGRPASFPR